MSTMAAPIERLRILRELQDTLRYLWYCDVEGCEGDPGHRLPSGVIHPYRHARAQQVPPGGDWRAWFLCTGRGFGKSRAAAEWVKDRMLNESYHRVAIIAPDHSVAKHVCMEGESGLVGPAGTSGVMPANRIKSYNKTTGELVLHNGSMVQIFGTNTQMDAEKVRGFQFHCLVAGTMVQTEHGERPIEDIKPGDLVWTRVGLRRVLTTGSKHAQVVRAQLGSRELVGTAEHLVLTENRGWVGLSSVHRDDTIILWDDQRNLDGDLTSTAATSTTEMGRLSTGTDGSGNNITVRFLTGGKSTTSTVTLPTTTLATSSPYRAPTMCYCTPGNHEVLSAEIVAPCSPTLVAAVPPSGALTAASSNSSSGVKRQTPRETDRTRPSALSAAPSSSPDEGPSAPCDVSTSGPTSAVVHNLEIEGVREFFANGVLTHNSMWYEEIATQRYGEVAWDIAQFSLRLGNDPRIVVTSTPRRTPLVKRLLTQEPGIAVTRGRTLDNAANLPAATVNYLRERYEGTTLGRQELDGELLDALPGALWTLEMIDADRREAPDDLDRVVVAIDPAGSHRVDSDETGIVVCGVKDDNYYVLADYSGTYTPEQWAHVSVRAYRTHEADRIVAEGNYGGDMVESVLRARDKNVAYRKVTATRGKLLRAEPIVALYERHLVHHPTVGFPELEDQMQSWVPPGQFEIDEKTGASVPLDASKWSPDRIDALCWALTDLSQKRTRYSHG